MRSAWLTGVVLGAGGVLLVVSGAWLDLDITPTALLGVTLGGALAAAPGHRDGAKLAAVGVGLVAAWIGYLLRAVELPDSPGGVAVALVVVVALCTIPAALLADRLPLWAALLGAGAFVGVYESSYAAAPAEMAATSVSALTSTLLVLGVGFLLGSVVARPVRASRHSSTDPQEIPS